MKIERHSYFGQWTNCGFIVEDYVTNGFPFPSGLENVKSDDKLGNNFSEQAPEGIL